MIVAFVGFKKHELVTLTDFMHGMERVQPVGQVAMSGQSNTVFSYLKLICECIVCNQMTYIGEKSIPRTGLDTMSCLGSGGVCLLKQQLLLLTAGALKILDELYY